MKPQVKQILGTVTFGLIAVLAPLGLIYISKLFDRLEINYWLSRIGIITMILVGGMLAVFNQIDPMRKKALVLSALGLMLLLIALVLNEYVTSFFAPSAMHMGLAFLPSVAFLAHQEFKEFAATSFNASADIEGWPFRILLGARVAEVIFLGIFLIFAFVGMPNGAFGFFLIASITFALFTDAALSYLFPKLAHKRPSNRFLAYVFQASLFAAPSYGRTYMAVSAVLFFVLFVGVLIMARGYR